MGESDGDSQGLGPDGGQGGGARWEQEPDGGKGCSRRGKGHIRVVGGARWEQQVGQMGIEADGVRGGALSGTPSPYLVPMPLF